MQNWKKSFSFHECLAKGVFNFEHPLLNLHTLNYHSHWFTDHPKTPLQIGLSPEATVTTIWKTAVCKRGISKRGILKCPVFHVLNFGDWIKLIYDNITLIYCGKTEFNPPYEVQDIENVVFQNAPFANTLFANSCFPNRGYSCLWAERPWKMSKYVQKRNRAKYLLVVVLRAWSDNGNIFFHYIKNVLLIAVAKVPWKFMKIFSLHCWILKAWEEFLIISC